jgi:hypothetical protein
MVPGHSESTLDLTDVQSDYLPAAMGSADLEATPEPIWVNLKTNIGHCQGMRWFHRTKHGALYDPDELGRLRGYRRTANGQ